MDKKGAKVYSYLRFSDPRQALGSSADRQLQYAQTWAAAHELELDQSLSLKDEGLSAYHQRHIKQGALGAFLRAVDEGRIPEGSVLIVEGLDRLSRAEPIQAQLAQIINAGLTVVTASDGCEYNRASLKAQPMDLVYSLLVMIRAHEESDTKSKRVKAAIRRQCEGWISGSYRGLVRNGKDPQWLHWNGQAWEFIPERLAAVNAALQMYRQGVGATRAVKILREQGHMLTDWGIAGQQLYRLVRLPALRGAKRVSVDGEDYLLEEYYPRVLTDEKFAELQDLTGQRYRRRGKGDIVGIITGIGITTCGYCGTALVAQNLISRAGPDGRLADGHRRLHCTSYSKNAGCGAGGSCSVVPVERAILEYCSDQMNLQRLFEPADDTQAIRQQLAAARQQLAETERQLQRITEALLSDEGAAPIAFLRKARELEALLSDQQVKVVRLEREQAGQALYQPPASAELWQELAGRALAMDVEAREQVRQLVLDTFQKIVIFIRGVMPLGRRASIIDILLISKTNQRRHLTVNRRSGVWQVSLGRE
ncbi:recombinase family protein [Pseudomonas rhizoryzae]|uniref:recombinase family protein n=1 Tax=Pseudomonas rhizoryzae TaxID=2571129 RepID=UPI0010C1B129|nr:recombinase family protein [Pseudomonas rhizoryzae]